MKVLNLGIVTLFLQIAWMSCHDVEIGYLITEYASYEVDSMVIRKELDTTPPVWGPNPEWQMYIDMGFLPEDIPLFFPGVEPETWVGGGEDYFRVKNNQPWTSSPIEGIEGTAPIWVKVKSAKSEDGDISKLLEVATVRGNGVIEVPLENEIPIGRYLISLTFWNEGWTKDLEDCFTIIVK